MIKSSSVRVTRMAEKKNAYKSFGGRRCGKEIT